MTAPTPADVPGRGEVEGLARLLLRAVLDDGDAEFIEDVGATPWKNALGQARAVLASDWLAEQIAAAEQRGREDNADHGMCYVSGSNALAERDAEVARAAKAEWDREAVLTVGAILHKLGPVVLTSVDLMGDYAVTRWTDIDGEHFRADTRPSTEGDA